LLFLVFCFVNLWFAGNLQGVFALMMPTVEWTQMCEFMRGSFDLAPADWLVGRWLFQNNWRIAFMPPSLAVYHCTGSAFQDSSRLSVAKASVKNSGFCCLLKLMLNGCVPVSRHGPAI
jgi:hypothetical protein